MPGVGTPGRRLDRPLIGRDPDLALLRDFVDEATAVGGALLVSGEAGVGKTVLLEDAAAHATQHGMRVLWAAGAQFEADVSFAGLNQLFQPLLPDLARLSPVHRRALGIALGLDAGPASGQLLVSNAALALLEDATSAGPVLVVVDDVQWMDRASARVLGFVARRVVGHQVGFLAAARTGEETFFEPNGVAGHLLGPLDDAASGSLLDDRYPAMPPRTRRRLQDEARGNPLALLELPAALEAPYRDPAGSLPPVLPLTERLQSVFAARVRSLPGATQDALLLAALEGTGDLSLLQSVLPGSGALDALAPAERARLVALDERPGRVSFRHPLTRSAVVDLSTAGLRRRMHRALAEALRHQPERRVWHLAEAATGPDEVVASLLQQVAHDHLRRGDSVGAIGELLRSADLSPAAADRASRLAEAAYLGAIVTGDLLDAPQLLEQVRRIDPERRGSLAGAVASSYKLLHADGDVDGAHRLLADAVDALENPGDAHNKVLIEALYTLLMVCFFGGRADLWTVFEAALKRLSPRPPQLLSVLESTLGDPVRRAKAMLTQLDSEIWSLSVETSPARIVRAGLAASYLDRLGECREALWRAVDHGRDGGAVTSEIEALFLLCNDGYLAGNWDQTVQLADEGLDLCSTHSYRLLAGTGLFYKALVAAGRGHPDDVRSLTDQMTEWATPRGVESVRAQVLHAQALAVLAQGDFQGAYGHLAAISPPGLYPAHVPQALWIVLDLVEAAVRCGLDAEATRHVDAVTAAGIAELSPRLALLAAGAAAMAAPEGHDLELFQDALRVTGSQRWPFDLARVQLAYGERLRRSKVTGEARRHLAAAVETFQRLGARPWAARAGNELRATGVSIGHHDAEGLASLTPQQREIAMLAAAGLTNKEIGERLFLSHRTVGTHLYQVFPKLGVTSRAALRDALTPSPATDSPPEAADSRQSRAGSRTRS